MIVVSDIDRSYCEDFLRLFCTLGMRTIIASFQFSGKQSVSWHTITRWHKGLFNQISKFIKKEVGRPSGPGLDRSLKDPGKLIILS